MQSAPASARSRRRRSATAGFTLVELLTVVAIISLLIGILLPSLVRSRNQAKSVKTLAQIKALDTGLELFRSDNEKEFRSTNGYPPSAGYSPDRFSSATAWRQDVHESLAPPTYDMYGANWLPRMLLGMDLLGFVAKKNVPEAQWDQPHFWYNQGLGVDPLPRLGPYLDPDKTRLLATNELTGAIPKTGNMGLNTTPVILDEFDRPFLYYAANPFVARKHGDIATDNDNDPGIYNFLDNEGFTGYGENSVAGFDFGAGQHDISMFGQPGDPEVDPKSFAHYIHNHGVGHEASAPTGHTLIAPYNRDTYFLITAGVDGKYGTDDDVTNIDRNE
ncbi:MAG: prepilin-type N-terminal cleavage/methylation domain-containing protein [bacterium]|nr:prepilin-type N-terminal cleavage/methylation domain-containing protein [bacterium]